MTEFRWGPWFGGLLLTLVGGMIADVFAALAGAYSNTVLLGAAIGILPGVAFILISRRASRNGFAQGMLVGGCVVLLVGGMCGAMAGGAWGG